MIARAVTALAGLIGLAILSGCAATAAPDGAITLDYLMPGSDQTAGMRIQADGHVEQYGTYGGDRDVQLVVTDYRRFVALVEPMRAYAGGIMPCPDRVPSEAEIKRNPLAAGGRPVIATLRWTGSGESVRLNLVCRQGPPALAKLKEAIDLLRRAPSDADPAMMEPANVIE